VKQYALRLGLAVRQPEKIRRPEVRAELAGLAANCMVVVGYGQIIPQSIIDLPRHGIINVHASLLPRYRGAAPIQWAIANGEAITGVTTMQIDAGLDTGAMLLKLETRIGPEETAAELSARLAPLGAQLLIETLERLEAGTLVAEPQDNALATLAPILSRDDGRIDWNLPAAVIHNRVRGFQPWPGAWTTFRGVRLHVWRAHVSAEHLPGAPGTIVPAGRRLLVCCAPPVALELLEVQLEGRKRVSATEFLNGQRLAAGEKLGE
jgi:methionyl-tRNA formyltransferase